MSCLSGGNAATAVLDEKRLKEIAWGIAALSGEDVSRAYSRCLTIERIEAPSSPRGFDIFNQERWDMDAQHYDPHAKDVQIPRTVQLHIAQTFPEDTDTYGTVIIAVVANPLSSVTSSLMSERGIPPTAHSIPTIVPCKGRTYRNVSRDVNLLVKRGVAASFSPIVCVIFDAPSSGNTASWMKQQSAYGRDQSSARGSGRQIFFVTPTVKRANRAVRNIVIAWGTAISGATQECVRNVPVVWRNTPSHTDNTPTSRLGRGPRFRRREPGEEDNIECASDYSDISTTPSVVCGKGYDALRSAPVPEYGQLTTPSRTCPEKDSSIRAVRAVDLHLFHPLTCDWVENCQVEVSEFTSEGTNITGHLDSIPSSPRFEHDNRTSIPKEMLIPPVAITIDGFRPRRNGKRPVVGYTKAKNRRYPTNRNNNAAVEELRPEEEFATEYVDTVIPLVNRAIMMLRDQASTTETDDLHAPIMVDELVLDKIIRKLLKEQAIKEMTSMKGNTSVDLDHLKEMLHESSECICSAPEVIEKDVIVITDSLWRSGVTSSTASSSLQPSSSSEEQSTDILDKVARTPVIKKKIRVRKSKNNVEYENVPEEAKKPSPRLLPHALTRTKSAFINPATAMLRSGKTRPKGHYNTVRR